MNDSEDSIRIEATRVITQYLSCIPKQQPMREDFLALSKALLIHLDDLNSKVQVSLQNTWGLDVSKEAVAKCLEQAVLLNPKFMEDQLSSVIDTHHTPIYCNKLISFAKAQQTW